MVRNANGAAMPQMRAKNAPLPEGFLLFKRRFYRAVLLRTCAITAAAAFTAIAVLVALWRFGGVDHAAWQWGTVPTLAALVALSLALAIQRPSEGHVARLLDARFGLGERAQTLLAFRGESGDMVALQRADTDRRLRELFPKKQSAHSVWISLCAFVLSAALLLGALLFPVKAETPGEQSNGPTGPAVEPFSLSTWQITAMENLIAEVRESDMAQAPREALVGELESLLETLRKTTTVPEMKAAVIAVIVRAGEIADEANSYDEISDMLKLSPHESVALLGEALSVPDNPMYRDHLDRIVASVTDIVAVVNFAAGIRQTLASVAIPEEDPLRISLITLAEDMELTIIYYSETVQDMLGDAISKFYQSSASALEVQYANSSTAVTVRSRLMEIFGISPSELPSTGESDTEVTPPSEQPPEGSSGAPGAGDTLYGSDDTVYYPEDNTHIEYGEKMGEFYARMQEQLESGGYSEEMKAFIVKYFEALYGKVEESAPNDN